MKEIYVFVTHLQGISWSRTLQAKAACDRKLITSNRLIFIFLGQNTNCPIDLVFIMDTSGGAISNGAQQPMRNFMSNLAGRLAPNSNVGVIAYGENAESKQTWITASSASSILSSLNFPSLGATNTDRALDMARTQFFNPPRSNPQFAILISEGPSASDDKLRRYQQACQNLKNTNTRIMVVGKFFFITCTCTKT